ncbi:glutaminase B [Pseudomonas oryzihabitans]|uniref:glutaminase B n=1 Tax=Pseudomonas oryzihabitans TaxID=47885 RepID=UPI002865E44D|nr:glutaminase B [Pseudomonas psychrotolerans]MDR6678509.1 glutaminase [Pseudomonas psychrotolerans]
MPELFDRHQLQPLLDRIAAAAPRHFGEGKVADYIPALAEVAPDQFGIAVCDVKGQVWRAGAADTAFSIQSISKVLNLVIAMQRLDEPDIWTRVGREPSGQAFNSMVQLEEEKGIPRNPFINAGAVLICELLVSRIMSIHWMMREQARRLAGNPALNFDDRVARSEMEHKARNAALAYLMKAYGNLHSEVNDVLDVYFHGCALAMSCVDVARAFAFLANGGINPQDGQPVVTPQQTRQLNALLLTCGLYDAAGDFAWRVGLPGKSGVGGGIVAIVPGQMSICVWSPRLDSYGNSVAGLRALETLVEGLGVAPLG